MRIKHLKPKRNSQFKQGYFKPVNPEKYTGDTTSIIYRSSWERKFCIYCDTNDNIVEWSSEPFKITYLSAKDDKIHSYYPDFYIRLKSGKKYIIEIKPKKYTAKPSPPKRKTKKKVAEYHHVNEQFVINMSKWKAAKRAAQEHDMEFMLITEDFFKNK